jgi:AcrR family transcriptional regulator
VTPSATATTKKRKRRTQAERRATTRAALLDATIDCLVEDGYANTTTTKVVERAGVSRGAQVHHFPTKAELVADAVRHLARRRAEEAQEEIGKVTISDPAQLSKILDLLWGLHNGPLYAASVELFVAARTDPEAKGSRAITMFIVEKGTPGFRVGRALDKTGWRSSDTAELAFEDCRVPADHLLGRAGGGFYAIMRNFQNERLVLGAMAVGEAQEALELTLDYVTTRKAFGSTLYEKQAIRLRLAMLAAQVEAGRQLVYHAAWLDAQGIDCTREVSMVKAYCCELVNEVMYACVQFHGGMGYMRESTIERMARDARVHSIGGGATEVMLEEVAKRLRR